MSERERGARPRRYDPYAKVLTRETYAHEKMKALRRDSVRRAAKAKRWGLVLGTLGRQGNPDVLRHVQSLLRGMQLPYVTVLLSEVFPAKLAAFPDVEAWVQVRARLRAVARSPRINSQPSEQQHT